MIHADREMDTTSHVREFSTAISYKYGAIISISVQGDVECAFAFIPSGTPRFTSSVKLRGMQYERHRRLVGL
jgi:hypothetical protein